MQAKGVSIACQRTEAVALRARITKANYALGRWKQKEKKKKRKGESQQKPSIIDILPLARPTLIRSRGLWSRGWGPLTALLRSTFEQIDHRQKARDNGTRSKKTLVNAAPGVRHLLAHSRSKTDSSSPTNLTLQKSDDLTWAQRFWPFLIVTWPKKYRRRRKFCAY